MLEICHIFRCSKFSFAIKTPSWQWQGPDCALIDENTFVDHHENFMDLLNFFQDMNN